MQGLGALGYAAELELLVEMEASSMVQHMVYGLVDTALGRLHGVEVLEVRMSQDMPIGQLL